MLKELYNIIYTMYYGKYYLLIVTNLLSNDIIRLKENLDKMNETQIMKDIKKIVSYFDYDHSWKDESFYNFTLAVNNEDGSVEFIPISISERIIGSQRNMMGRRVKVIGKFNYYNRIINGQKNKIFKVKTLNLELIGSVEKDSNQIYIDGKILFEPKFRVTPNGNKITNLIISIENNYGKKKVFSVIVFGEAAEKLKLLKPEDNLQVTGKIQSRKYINRDENGRIIGEKVNYEILALEVAI